MLTSISAVGTAGNGAAAPGGAEARSTPAAIAAVTHRLPEVLMSPLPRPLAATVLLDHSAVRDALVEAAATFDIPVAPHWHADIHVHLVAAVPNALTVEYFSLDEDIYNFERLLADRLQPKDGLIPLRDRPGVGLELDRAAVGRFRIG